MKLRDTFRQISGIANSSLIASYLDGVVCRLPGIGEVRITAQKPTRSIRPEGFTFNTYSYFTEVVASNGVTAVGFGEDDLPLLALQKSIVEGVERVVFRCLKATHPTYKSSNGWAAHVSAKKSENSALFELLERDAVLLHWLSSTPLLEIQKSSIPKNISIWSEKTLKKAKRFNNLRILVSTLGYIPTATTAVLDGDGFGVLSHASGKDAEDAIAKALSEACRIAHIADQSGARELAFDRPEDHALAYAFNRGFPDFIFGNEIDLGSAERMWAEKLIEFKKTPPAVSYETIKCGSIFVTRAHSQNVQDLFFGETETAVKNGWINSRRITEVCGGIGLNPLPHFVP